MSTDNNASNSFGAIFKKFWWAFAGAALVVLIIIVVGILNSIQSTFNEGERKEQTLTALYNSSLNSLSTCLDQGRTAAQVTEQEFEKLKEILVEVAGARYAEEDGTPTDASQVIGGGALFSAVVEAYPQIDQRSWQNLQTVVVGCRDEFQGSQDRIQASANDYEQWRVSNDIFNGWIKGQFPSDELTVTTPSGDVLYAKSAFAHITRVVSVAEANQAFETGELDEQDLFGDE